MLRQANGPGTSASHAGWRPSPGFLLLLVGLAIGGGYGYYGVYAPAQERAEAERAEAERQAAEAALEKERLQDQAEQDRVEHERQQADPTPDREMTVGEKLASTANIADALALLLPTLKDTENELDPGTMLFAVWAAMHLTWADLLQQPETHYGLVMKDADAERGNRMCGGASIVEIAVDDSAGVKLYRGIMIANYHVASFIAVGSTGHLVERSHARFCGIVMGRHSYANAGGGTTHSVSLVGMFDLPENRVANAHAAAE